MGLMANIGSPIEAVKKVTANFKFSNSPVLDTLIGSRIRTLGDSLEDTVYGMMGPFGEALLSAKEQAEIQREIADKVESIYPYTKLKDKMVSNLIKRINRKAAAIGKKDPDARGRLTLAAADVKGSSSDINKLIKAIMAAVRLDATLAGIVDQAYDAVLDAREKDGDLSSPEAKETKSKTIRNFDFAGNQDSIKQLLVAAKEAEFKSAIDNDLTMATPANIKKYQDEVKAIQNYSVDELRDNTTTAIDDEDFRAAFANLVKNAATQTSKAPLVQRTQSAKAAVQKAKGGRPVGSKDKVQRVRSPNRVRDAVDAMGSTAPNLRNVFNGSSDVEAGIADGITSGMESVPDTKLIAVLQQVESVLKELGRMIQTGEVKPIQIGDVISQELKKLGLDDNTTEGDQLESDLETGSWQDQMLDNTKEIREALTGRQESEEKEDKGNILSSLMGFVTSGFSSFSGLITKIIPIFSGLLTSIPLLIMSLKGGAMSALSGATGMLGKGKGAIGKMSGVTKGGIAGLVGGVALDYAGEKLAESGHEKLAAGADIGSDALAGASTGAMIGSVIPGVGTLIGGAVGGVAGGAYGLYKNWDTLFDGSNSPDLELKNQQVIKDAGDAAEAAANKAKTIGDTNTNVNTAVNNTTVQKPINTTSTRNPDSGVRRIQDKYGVFAL